MKIPAIASPIAGILLALTLALPGQAATSEQDAAAPLPTPSTELKPDEVVKIVVDALARNDLPYTDAGIATTFNFASPANKVNTGPLDKFIRMVKDEPYGIMVNHIESELSEVVYKYGDAYQLVRMTAADGRVVVFAFRLSKQSEGEFKDMWMTDAVWPVSNGLDPGLPL